MLFHKLQFGTLPIFSAGFDAVTTSRTAPKGQVSLYSTPEAFCGEIHTSVLVMYAFRSESYIGFATVLPDNYTVHPHLSLTWVTSRCS